MLFILFYQDNYMWLNLFGVFRQQMLILESMESKVFVTSLSEMERTGSSPLNVIIITQTHCKVRESH